MLNTCFDKFLPDDKKCISYYPENLRTEIDELNGWVYDTVNNGVYKSGFATTQQACKCLSVCSLSQTRRVYNGYCNNGFSKILKKDM